MAKENQRHIATHSTIMSAGRRKKQVISPCGREMSERWMLTTEGYASMSGPSSDGIASAMCLGSRFAVSSMSARVRATFRMRSWVGNLVVAESGAFEPALAVSGELAVGAHGPGGHRSNRGAESLVEHHERSTGMEIIPAPRWLTKADRRDCSIYTRREHPRCDLSPTMSARDCGKLGLYTAEQLI